jgi:hypothetical protein
LLNTINPDLVQFHGNTLQPVNIAAPAVTTGITTPLAGYNIGAYDAGEPQQAVAVTSIYNRLLALNLSTADQMTQYMNSSAQGIGKSGSPITGQMVLSASSATNVDPKMVMAIMEEESHYGSDGASTAVANFNPGNIQSGNSDINYGNWQAGVNAVANWLNGHRA